MTRQKRVPLTQRELQCQKVAREKARRKRVSTLWLRVRVGMAGAAFSAVAVAGVWEFTTGGISQFVGRTVDGAYEMTAEAGFAVRGMVLEGRSRTPLAAVTEALDVRSGTPILAVSLDELRQKLEAIPTVKSAAVERALPDRLFIRLTERVPVALWQKGGRLFLIDDEGAVMNDLALKDYRDLPLVLGDGAPGHVGEALALIGAQPELKALVQAAVRVGDRRWNIRLKDGVEIRLPEENPIEAWQRVALMQKEQQILHRAIRTIDLRAEDRVTIQLAPMALPPARGARET